MLGQSRTGAETREPAADDYNVNAQCPMPNAQDSRQLGRNSPGLPDARFHGRRGLKIAPLIAASLYIGHWALGIGHFQKNDRSQIRSAIAARTGRGTRIRALKTS